MAPLTGCTTHQEYRIEQSHDDGATWIHPHFRGSHGRDLTVIGDRLLEAITEAGEGVKHRLVARTVSTLTTGWVER